MAMMRARSRRCPAGAVWPQSGSTSVAKSAAGGVRGEAGLSIVDDDLTQAMPPQSTWLRARSTSQTPFLLCHRVAPWHRRFLVLVAVLRLGLEQCWWPAPAAAAATAATTIADG